MNDCDDKHSFFFGQLLLLLNLNDIIVVREI